MKSLALLLILFLNFQLIHSQTVISGTVLNRRGHPVEGSIVHLDSEQLSDTTDASGSFVITLDPVSTSRVISSSREQVSFQEGQLIINSLHSQQGKVSLYDLRGRMLKVLHEGMMETGTHTIPLPREYKNRSIVADVTIGSAQRTFFLNGQWSNKTGATVSKKSLQWNAEAAVHTLRITHELYDDKVVTVQQPYDSVTVHLFSKLVIDEDNAILIGDTLKNSRDGLALSLDSIIDERCPCDDPCIGIENAYIYLSLRSKETSEQLVLETFNKRTVSALGYIVSLNELEPDCQSDSARYIMNFTISPEQSILLD
ncbi:carboxypeptidase-like regulatory domain-containing protein [Chitinispirillales bacterium ANBcel5]|uniref:carboxypeptidase-like regulatory domain-containing protein n=1 Tax=Cellulosispirillum alkaliphilum TaxID=3039283 RepID=UPI002A51EB49|nr:carboxypeptidase-like regulatory domain-containing protein [Chitinispirillales bacterium ANBcel5]